LAEVSGWVLAEASRVKGNEALSTEAGTAQAGIKLEKTTLSPKESTSESE